MISWTDANRSLPSETYQQWCKLLDGIGESSEDEADIVEELNIAGVQRELDEAMIQLATIVLPKPMVNLFSKKKVFKTETTALQVTNRAHWRESISA